MYVCMYVRTYVRTFVCMYVCMYVCNVCLAAIQSLKRTTCTILLPHDTNGWPMEPCMQAIAQFIISQRASEADAFMHMKKIGA